jgi:hypothetical protein
MSGRMFRPSGGPPVAVIGADESDQRANCFADEVVIDFPSVAPAVDRIRSSFLAEERSAALAAVIELSRHEASCGATVPLHVPVRCTCHECGGRGETWAEACRRCGGSGAELLQHRVQVLLPAGVVDGTCFHFTVTPRHHPPTRIELRVRVS